MKFKLLPLGNVAKSSIEGYEWEATNSDPQFWLKGWQQLAGRHVRVSFQILIKDLLVSPCVLYPDFGEGPSEKTAIYLKLSADGKVEQELIFPLTLRGLRFDPIAQPGFFSIPDMKIQLLAHTEPFLKRIFAKSRFLFSKEIIPTTNNYIEPEFTYQKWIEAHEPMPSKFEELRERSRQWNDRPLISILMPTYNAPEKYLRLAIESVQSQIYENWELCIADDCSSDANIRSILKAYASRDARLKVCFREKNGHISAATNSALELATGSYIGLLDHDDELHPLALYCIAKAIKANPDVALIYTDEDKISEEGTRSDPYFKCSFNYDLMLGQNMICHFGVYQTKLVRQLGGMREGFEGSQDYDLALRVLDHAGKNRIIHVPRILYHWRLHPLSTSAGHDAKPYAQTAAMRAINAHLERIGVCAEVRPAPNADGFNQVCYALPANLPVVEIIIPTRDAASLVRQCISSVFEKTDYKNFKITVIDNGSTEAETFELFSQLKKDSRIRIVRDEAPFNYSALNNRIGLASTADFICLMNNDIEVICEGWLSEMLSLAIQAKVGCVGAKLLYPDDTLQHGGVIIGVGGVAGHSHKRLLSTHPGYFSRVSLRSTMSAVTAACLLVRQSIFKEVGGLDEQLEVAFNDVDFCLRIGSLGYRNIWTPYAELYHHESATRGYEDSPEKIDRFNREVEYVKSRWGESLLNDPYYSPNLTLDTEDFAYAWPPRVTDITRHD